MIERGDWRRLGSRHACGFLPIARALIETARQGLTAHRFALCNSGDTAGGRARVVGYGAWGF
jgi:AmmeMemoRadiSam system protein B